MISLHSSVAASTRRLIAANSSCAPRNDEAHTIYAQAKQVDAIVCLSFHPISKEHVHALKGLACRKRVAAASSPAATCKQDAALTSPARHACGCARPSHARFGHRSRKVCPMGPKLKHTEVVHSPRQHRVVLQHRWPDQPQQGHVLALEAASTDTYTSWIQFHRRTIPALVDRKVLTQLRITQHKYAPLVVQREQL